MWSRMKRKAKNVLSNVIKRVRWGEWAKDDEWNQFDEQSVERLEHLLSQKSQSDIELQASGQWLSKSVIEAVLAESYEQKLLNLCQQKEVYRLESIFTKELYRTKETLWSGCYSEVVKVVNTNGEDIILKISLINRRNKAGVVVQNVSSIVTDVINSKLLSDLKNIPIDCAKNYCENFAEVQKFYYTWTERSVFNKSEFSSDKENNRYEYFICQQTYGGKQLDSLESISPSVGLNLILQLIASLAVAEVGLHFEHRDLHLSNLLYKKETKKKSLEYVINGHKFTLRLNGYKLVIIDTTFSRTDIKIPVEGKKRVHHFYNDLSSLNLRDYRNKELKKVYLKQKEITEDNWKKFYPKTNIVWLSYSSKAIGLKCDKWCREKKSSNELLSRIKMIQKRIDSCKSAKELCLQLLSDTNFDQLKSCDSDE